MGGQSRRTVCELRKGHSMGALVAADRDFWTDVLTAGGFTPVPRWTRRPVPGVAEHGEPVPDEVARA
ncbi:hypothetical protein GTY23_41930, partial [Streptomyces sp. SID5998]|nr:hypothetical protein [Streptomyces sp. SID5998]